MLIAYKLILDHVSLRTGDQRQQAHFQIRHLSNIFRKINLEQTNFRLYSEDTQKFWRPRLGEQGSWNKPLQRTMGDNNWRATGTAIRSTRSLFIRFTSILNCCFQPEAKKLKSLWNLYTLHMDLIFKLFHL